MAKKSTKAPVAVIEPSSIGQLAARAMLLDLDVHFWTAHTRDLDITDEVNKKHNTDGSYNKRLIPKKEMRDLWSAYNDIVTTHKRFTLPWADNGPRIIMSEGYFQYSVRIREKIDAFNAAADAFAKRYDQLVAEQKVRENGSFNPKHYMTRQEMRRRYGVEIHISPVPLGTDLRVKLSNDALAAVSASMNEDNQARLNVALGDIAERIRDVVSKLSERLKEYTPATEDGRAEHTFRDTIVDNVRDLANLLPALNITGSPKITAMANELQELAKARPYALRADEKLRNKTVKAADHILQRVSDFI